MVAIRHFFGFFEKGTCTAKFMVKRARFTQRAVTARPHAGRELAAGNARKRDAVDGSGIRRACRRSLVQVGLGGRSDRTKDRAIFMTPPFVDSIHS